MCNELCRKGIGVRGLCHRFGSLPFFRPPFFIFSILGKVQSAAQEDQPHLGLCGDASQRAAEVNWRAADTRQVRKLAHAVISVQSVQTEEEGRPHRSRMSGAGLLAHQQTPGTFITSLDHTIYQGSSTRGPPPEGVIQLY